MLAAPSEILILTFDFPHGNGSDGTHIAVRVRARVRVIGLQLRLGLGSGLGLRVRVRATARNIVNISIYRSIRSIVQVSAPRENRVSEVISAQGGGAAMRRGVTAILHLLDKDLSHAIHGLVVHPAILALSSTSLQPDLEQILVK